MGFYVLLAMIMNGNKFSMFTDDIYDRNPEIIRDPLSGSRPASIMSGSSGSRSPFAEVASL